MPCFVHNTKHATQQEEKMKQKNTDENPKGFEGCGWLVLICIGMLILLSSLGLLIYVFF